jgi:hypothetical protein
MKYAFIKDDVCFNIVIFEDQKKADAFKTALMATGVIDDLVLLKDELDFGIGDIYKNGVWTRGHYSVPTPEPTVEERLTIAEDMINFLLGL